MIPLKRYKGYFYENYQNESQNPDIFITLPQLKIV
jgi:hypothetical protein